MESSRARLSNATMFIAITGLVVALPLLGASGRLIYLAALSAMWATAVYGLFLPYALAGQTTAATITVWGTSAFSVALAANEWSPPLLVLFLIGIGSGFIAGSILALPILRTAGHYFVVMSFAAVVLATIAASNWSTIDNLGSGVFVTYEPTLGPWSLERPQDVLWLGAACLVVCFIAVELLTNSRLGRRWTLVRENEQLAATVGCPVKFYKWFALAVGGALTGVAGVLPVVLSNHVQISDYGGAAAITFFIVLIIGGRRSIVGPIIGALFWFVGPELIGVEPLIAQMVFAAVLTLTMVVTPDGVVDGVRRVVRFVTQRGTGGSVTPALAGSPSTDITPTTPSETAAAASSGGPDGGAR